MVDRPHQTEDGVMAHPDHPDDQEADRVAKIVRPRIEPQVISQRMDLWCRKPDIEDEQRHGHGKGAVGEGFSAPGVHDDHL